MDADTKRALGRILGELFQVQEKLGIEPTASPQKLYALTEGFEGAADEFFLDPDGECVDRAFMEKAAEVLEHFWDDQERRESFTGFYDLEEEMQRRGYMGDGDKTVRMKLITVLTYFKLGRQFMELIEVMERDDSNSPVEAKNFDPP